MTHKQVEVRYNRLLHSFGLPFRLANGSSFDLKTSLKTYEISEDKIVSVSRQQDNFDMAMKDEPGWLMYVVSSGIIDKARHVAANIMQSYLERDLKAHWLSNVDYVKHVSFGSLKLVVIDALFFDSSAYRRDKIYELINYNCNVPDLSVLVIAQNTDPLAVANQLAMKPNLAMLLK